SVFPAIIETPTRNLYKTVQGRILLVHPGFRSWIRTASLDGAAIRGRASGGANPLATRRSHRTISSRLDPSTTGKKWGWIGSQLDEEELCKSSGATIAMDWVADSPPNGQTFHAMPLSIMSSLKRRLQIYIREKNVKSGDP
ncbi:hypothetical protein BC938DRAFT_475415, partial [Jimgerdemannia flammicorona]